MRNLGRKPKAFAKNYRSVFVMFREGQDPPLRHERYDKLQFSFPLFYSKRSCLARKKGLDMGDYFWYNVTNYLLKGS